jgi:hypothetical protein
MSDANLVPFDWWWSGKYWYCRVHQKALSGCGLTKPQAAHDARLELKKYQHKRRLPVTA